MKTKLLTLLILIGTVCVLPAQIAVETEAPAALSQSTLDKLADWDAKLQNAPFGVLIWLALVCLCSVMAYVEFCPDKIIPFVSVAAAVAGMLLLAPQVEGLAMRIWIGKNLFIGIISGILAWMAAMKFGRAIVERFAKRPPLSSMFAMALAGALAAGCVPRDDQMAVYIADARDLGEVGTALALLESPDTRTALEYTVLGLRELELQPDTVTLDSLTAVLKRLPVDKLQSPKSQLEIIAGRIFLRRVGADLKLANIKDLRPIVTALREGMELSLKLHQ